MTGGRLLRGWQRIPVGLVIASFLVINAFGLCNLRPARLHLIRVSWSDG
jgi:hypothetical protein